MKFSLRFSQFPADLVTFTEEIVNGKLQFLRSVEAVDYFCKNSVMVFYRVFNTPPWRSAALISLIFFYFLLDIIFITSSEFVTTSQLLLKHRLSNFMRIKYCNINKKSSSIATFAKI